MAGSCCGVKEGIAHVFKKTISCLFSKEYDEISMDRSVASLKTANKIENICSIDDTESKVQLNPRWFNDL
jgi:hypothetical protein